MSEANMPSGYARLLDMEDEMIRFAGSLCRDWHMAQDLAQDAMVKALNTKKDLDKITNLRAWAFKVVRNCWIDKVRHFNRRVKTQTIETNGSTNEAIASYETNPHIDALNAHGHGRENYDMLFSDEIKKALNEIPRVYTDALMLSAIEDNNYSEVAAKLSIPEGTVRSRIFRGRKLLRKVLQESSTA